ncbi:MAG: TM2 domain-containing protein [Clostridia bacterium]|nr:TM2 domain-containing protein [Clostridia bacterium]
MYCKNCGNEIDPGAAICVKCGYQKGTGNRFCHNCGKELTPGAVYCMNCGFAAQQSAPTGTEQKSKLAAGLLGILLGWLGVHNFYLGFTGKAVAQLILGLLGCTTIISVIWGLVEGIQILTSNEPKDARGIPLKD